MKRIIFMLTLILLFVGCNESSINRSVLQPIGETEIAKLERKYPNISTFYKYVMQVRNSQSDEMLQNYSNLTYKQVYDFFTTYADQEDDIKEIIKEEWLRHYGFYETKLDSLHDNLSDWFEANKLESRVKITCVDVLPTPEDANAWQALMFYCKVKVENLTNEPIEDVEYYLAICDTKDNAFGDIHFITNTAEKADGSLYMAWSTQYGKTWSNDQESLLDYGQEDLYKHYNIDYRIKSLRQNGKLLTNDIIKDADPNYHILSKQLWKTNMTSTGRLYYLKEAVKSIFNVNYLTFDEYYNEVIDSKVQAIDSESFNFLSPIITFKL